MTTCALAQTPRPTEVHNGVCPFSPIRTAAGDVLPVIVVDTREKAPLSFVHLPSVTEMLTIGDYTFRGGERLFAVERKSVNDLATCCDCEQERGRLARQIHRMQACRWRRILIIGTRAEVVQHRYRSSVSPKTVLATLAEYEMRFDAPVYWAPTPSEGAEMVERWTYWAAHALMQEAASLLQGGGILNREPDDVD